MVTDSKKLPTIEGFTPGPWHLAAISGKAGINKQDLRASNPSRSIAHLRAWDDQDLADSQLIEAAPNLYRIAHEQREVIRELYNALMDSYPCACNMAGCCICGPLNAAAPYLED